MLRNENVSMSIGHRDHVADQLWLMKRIREEKDHVLIVYSSMEHVTSKSPGPMCVPIHACKQQDVIKMSDGRRNVVIR